MTNLAKALPVLGGHHVDHVFATWYSKDRRTDALIVVDVSGSMAKPAPGSTTPLIGLVREGVRSLGGMLPNDARLGLWEFGSRLQGTSDHRELLRGPLVVVLHRQDRARALAHQHDLRRVGRELLVTAADVETAERVRDLRQTDTRHHHGDHPSLHPTS